MALFSYIIDFHYSVHSWYQGALERGTVVRVRLEIRSFIDTAVSQIWFLQMLSDKTGAWLSVCLCEY